MLRWFRLWHEAKKQKSQQLWEGDSDIVKDGLDEAQVVGFVNDLTKRHETLSSVPVGSVRNPAVTGTEPIAAGTETKAPTEAKNKEAARVTAQADKEAEKIGGPGQAREKVVASKPVGVITEEHLEPHLPEERPVMEETEPTVLKPDSKALYAGEVELAVTVPVDLKLVSKLYNGLQTIPELRILHTIGSVNQGTIITVVLDKPMPLAKLIASKVPGIAVIPELPEKDASVKERSDLVLGKRQTGVRRLRLTQKGVSRP